MRSDLRHFAKLHSRANLEKSVNSLLGIVEGILIDGSINADEVTYFHRWLQEHEELRHSHPINELLPVVERAISTGNLAQSEREDVTWLCEKLCYSEYVDRTTADLQRLHALVGGIIADGALTEAELRWFSTWLQEHEHLKTCWPYDEFDSLVTAVLADGRIDKNEHIALKNFFSEFVPVLDERTIVSPIFDSGNSMQGLCAVCPEIEFSGARFCFTGASSRYSRTQLFNTVESLGGKATASISSKVNFLVIGSGGNPCWSYACYGRKVEKTVELRKADARMPVIHENDFHDAVLEAQRA